MKPITSYPIAPEDVGSYFAVHFAENARMAQILLMQWMQQLCPGYDTDGTWAGFELSNGGFYVAPTSKAQFSMVSPNGYTAAVSAQAAGIVVSLFAINQVADETQSDYLMEAYHALRHFGAEHPEAPSILGLTD